MINVEQNVLCGEICHVEIGEMFPHGRFLPMSNGKCGANLFCGEISPHEKCPHTSNEKCGEYLFVAIYAVLSQNLFCCDLRAFVWRKIGPKIVLVERKKTNIRYVLDV